MKLVKVERDDNHLATLTVEVDAQEFEKAVEKAYKKGAVRLNVPGFRRGKAPRKMIETLYGTSMFYEDAVNDSYPEVYRAALDESGLEPVEKADVDIQDVSENGYTFTASFHVYPDVTVGEYKGLEGPWAEPAVADEEIDAELARLQERNARLVAVERAIQDGDTAVFDFEGFVDGTPFEGGQASSYSLKIGSGRFIPGFEEQMVGLSAGDEKDVPVTFPEEYHAPELAGKPAVFKIKVHEVKETEKPALDDEFVKDISEFDTLEQFKDDLKAKMLHEREHQVADAFEKALTRQVIDGLVAVIPDVMVEDQLSDMLQDFSYRLSAQGMELSTYLQYTGMSMEDLQNDMREQARDIVKSNLAFEQIAKQEKLEITVEDLEAEYGKIALRYKMPTEQVKAAIPERSLRRDLARLKGSEFVTANAVKKAPDEASEQPKAKTAKASAKSKEEAPAAEDEKPKTRKKPAVKAEEKTGE